MARTRFNCEAPRYSRSHDAKGVISWVWPTSDDLAAIHGALASVVTKSPVLDFLVREKPRRIKVDGLEILDVAYWVIGTQMLVCIVNGGYDDVDPVWISFPENERPRSLGQVVWGNTSWEALGFKLYTERMAGMKTSMILVNL